MGKKAGFQKMKFFSSNKQSDIAMNVFHKIPSFLPIDKKMKIANKLLLLIFFSREEV